MPGTLTKMEIVSAVQAQNGYTLIKSTDIVNTLLEILKFTLASGDDVLISGFGKFQVKDKRERRGRNPATDCDMILPPRRVVTFKCSGQLRDKVHGG